MTGHPEAELAAYAAGDVTAAERERLERHLVECATCRAAVADFQAVLGELAATAGSAAPVDGVAWPRYRAEVRARLAAHRARSWRSRWLRPLPVTTSAAVATALAVIVYLAIPTPPPALEYEGLAAVEQLDLLEDLDVIRNLDGLGGARES